MHVEEQAPKLIQPEEHKAKVALWSDLTVSDVDFLNEASTTDQVKRELVRIFSLDDYEENIKSSVLLDLYAYSIQFSKENKFSREQTSVFFSIIKKTHEICTETPFGNVDQCFRHFRELLLCHSVKRSPFSLDLFSGEEGQKITNYVINTYFRHYKMYKCMFTPLVRLDLTMTYIGMRPTPPPSEAGDEEEIGEEEKGEKEGGEETKEGNTAEEAIPAASDQSVAAVELRSLVQKHLGEELKKLRLSVDEQMRESDNSLSKRLTTAEKASSSAKSARGKRAK